MLRAEARVVLLHQSDEFTLQGRKSLDRNWTQGSIHGRASSSCFDTLIFQPFGRCPHLFLPQAAVNPTDLSNSASPSKISKRSPDARDYQRA
jgi:hypothetical protein